jgi:hypothetical protein
LTRSITKIGPARLADGGDLVNVRQDRLETLFAMPTEQPYLKRSDSAEHCIVEARRLAHEVEALLVEAARDPGVDAYALRIAQGLARSLIDQLVERPTSSSRLESRLARGRVDDDGDGRGGSGSAQVA